MAHVTARQAALRALAGEGGEPAQRPAEPAVTVEDYLATLAQRRQAAREGGRAGEVRGLGLAMAWLRIFRVAWVRWALEGTVEAERDRPGEFWQQSCKALRRVLRELNGVGYAPACPAVPGTGKGAELTPGTGCGVVAG